jgi:hypothetical protein
VLAVLTESHLCNDVLDCDYKLIKLLYIVLSPLRSVFYSIFVECFNFVSDDILYLHQLIKNLLLMNETFDLKNRSEIFDSFFDRNNKNIADTHKLLPDNYIDCLKMSN